VKTTQTLYNLLGINNKIKDVPTRYLYLKDVWGLEQNDIADIEGVSQSQVSKVLLQARKGSVVPPVLEFGSDEIKYLQFLPREIILDSQLVAFVENILNYEVDHQFFQFFLQNDNIRIAALASLGIQNKKLQQIFKKAQSSVSMNIKRNTKRALELERPNRYEVMSSYSIVPRETKEKPKQEKPKFLLAGGQTNE
jgi:hypothetical protein